MKISFACIECESFLCVCACDWLCKHVIRRCKQKFLWKFFSFLFCQFSLVSWEPSYRGSSSIELASFLLFLKVFLTPFLKRVFGFTKKNKHTQERSNNIVCVSFVGPSSPHLVIEFIYVSKIFELFQKLFNSTWQFIIKVKNSFFIN